MNTNQGLEEWLTNIRKFGIGFVSGVPKTASVGKKQLITLQATEGLTKRIAHIRETHYGGLWTFTADLSRGDLAYTNIALGLHTDTTYFTDPVGLQLFHVLEHDGQGGESVCINLNLNLRC